MLIGKFDFSEKLKNLTLANFKKFWKDGGYESKTGKTENEAALIVGIKVPKKK